MERMTLTKYKREQLKAVSEAEIQKEIRAYLKETSRPYTLTDASKSLNVKGQQVQRVAEFWPDLTTITFKARMFCIEVKRPIGGRLSYGQALRLRQLHEAGVLVCIARSVDDVRYVEALGSATPAMLDEIERVIHKGPPVNKGLKAKAIDESVGF